MPKPPAWIHAPCHELLQIRLLGGNRRHYGLDWGGGHPMINDFSRLYILESGQAEVETATGRTALAPGAVYLIPAGARTAYTCRKPMTLLWVHFRLEVLPGLDIFSHYQPPTGRPQRPGDWPRLRRLIDACAESGPAALLEGMSLLLALLPPFLPAGWNDILPSRSAAEQLMPAVHAMTSRLETPLTLAELAREVHLHPTYFSNRFREVFGIAPMRYLTELRLRRARALLRQDAGPIADIAQACGFTDPYYFSRVFRKQVGMPPSRFRRGGSLEAL